MTSPSKSPGPSGALSKPVLLFLTLFLSILAIPVYLWYQQPLAVIVPHHDVVKSQRIEALQLVSQKRLHTKRIILLSPNHFSPSQIGLTTTNRPFTLSNGTVTPPPHLVTAFLNLGENSPSLLHKDHGITNVLPDLTAAFPKAEVFPILLGQSLPKEKLAKLSSFISQFCDSNCLVVASVDFSHYLPPAFAQIHDLTSQQALRALSLDTILALEVDSPQSLYVTAFHAHTSHANSWHQYSHTNSALMEKNRDAESTSHIIGWYARNLLPSLKTKTTTFTYANNPAIHSQSCLGARAQYGNTHQNMTLTDPVALTSSFSIVPLATGSSTLVYQKTHTTLNLGSDLLLTGAINQSELILAFLPLNQQPCVSFQRGTQKTDSLNQLLVNLSNAGLTYIPENGMVKGKSGNNHYGIF